MREEKKQINYAVVCVNEFANKHNLTVKEAFQCLFKHKAIEFLKRVSRIYGGNPIVNLYEIDDNYMKNKELKIINFGTIPSEKWAVFVMNNRNRTFIDFKSLDCNFDYKYDIVVGPIADDDMAILFRQYQNNLISLQALLNGMTYQKTTSQYSFHTEKAVSLLKKVGVLQ